MRVFGVVGFKNAGKTRLMVALVRHFSADGVRVATVKHAHHDFDIDQPGKDSWQHREAGAREVLIGSARRWAHITELGEGAEPTLPELLAHLAAPDLVLVEGFKAARHPKLQVVGASEDRLLVPQDPTVIALACDRSLPEVGVPVYARDDVQAIARCIETSAAPPARWAGAR